MLSENVLGVHPFNDVTTVSFVKLEQSHSLGSDEHQGTDQSWLYLVIAMYIKVNK